MRGGFLTASLFFGRSTSGFMALALLTSTQERTVCDQSIKLSITRGNDPLVGKEIL